MNDEIVTLVICGIGFLRAGGVTVDEELQQRIIKIAESDQYDELMKIGRGQEVRLIKTGVEFIEENM